MMSTIKKNDRLFENPSKSSDLANTPFKFPFQPNNPFRLKNTQKLRCLDNSRPIYRILIFDKNFSILGPSWSLRLTYPSAYYLSVQHKFLVCRWVSTQQKAAYSLWYHLTILYCVVNSVKFNLLLNYKS